jgi:hypothetical protein
MRQVNQNTAVDLFGGNSEGGMAMWAWLDVMCAGCRHESARQRRAGNGGGYGCELVTRAVCDPGEAPMPEWSPDAAPKPERLAELGPGPWPVCLAHEPRTKRSDAGKRRGPRIRGMQPLFVIIDEMERTRDR